MGPPVGQAMEFLSQVLSQRGPDAVPYQENVKWTIREHLSELIKMFPTLSLSTNEFHANDGRIHNLLKAEGTVPIHFQGTKYNIPICLWLPERYPMSAPLVYVTPTPNMVIKQGHSFVNGSGLVHSPYISNWLFPSSDLSTLTQEMAMLFGTEPPLYSKPAGYTLPPVPQPGSLAAANGGLGATGGYGDGVAGYNPMYPGQQQQQGGYQQQQAGMGQYPGMGAGPASSMDAGAMHQHTNSWAGPGAYAANSQQQPLDRPQQPQQQHQQQPSPQKPEPPGAATQRQLQADFRALALGALASRLQTASEAYNKHAAGEMERLLSVQRQLADRDQELQRVVSAIQQERAGTEGIVAELGAKCAALNKWLEDNEWKVTATGVDAAASPSKRAGAAGARTPLDVNKVIVAADGLSRQALQAQADDLAIEDALTVLDKALHGGQLAADAYLKQARLLCRQQFFARAKGLKVAAAQRAPQQQGQQQQQQQQQRWQGGAPGYPMTVGDAWMHGGTLTNPLGGAAAGQ